MSKTEEVEMKRLRPVVKYTNPSFYLILVGQVLGHIVLGFNGLLGNPTSPAWTYIGGDGGAKFLGAIHLILAVAIILGMYLKFKLVRQALTASVTAYIATWLAFLIYWISTVWQWHFNDGKIGSALVLGLTLPLIFCVEATRRMSLIEGDYDKME